MRSVIIVSFLCLSCSGPVPSKPTPPPSRETPSERNIYIDAVEVANPIVVTGRARTFENNVVLRAKDARGALIAETFTTSTGEMGRHNPYRGTIWITRDPGAQITIEALDYSAKDGSEQFLVSATRPFSIEPIEATLFFPDTQCTGVSPYKRRIPKSLSHARLLVESLLAGPLPSEHGAVSAFPSGSSVQSVNLRDGVLTVDFNERLRNVGGACRAQMIRDSVARTLETLPSVRKVVITAGGSEELALQP